MDKSLDVSEQTRDLANRSERHSRIIAYASLGLSIASLAAAVIAIFVGH
jgi:hypothetical protein